MSKKSRKKISPPAESARAEETQLTLDKDWWLKWGPPIGLIVITFLVLSPALWGAYIWDDPVWLLQNPLVHQARFADMWLGIHSGAHYYPLVFTTFAIEYKLWGLGVLGADGLLHGVGYHAVNLALHIGSVLLIFKILRELRLPGGVIGAAISAGLWAIHPVNVESVAWISERKNVLCGIFFFAALLFAAYHFALTAQAHPRWKSGGGYALMMIAFLLAMFSKTVACVFPAAILLLIWWRRGRVTWREIAETAPLFVIGLFMAGVTAHLEHTQVGAAGPDYAFSPGQRVLIAGTDLWFYFGKAVWPWPVVQLYERFDIHAGQATTNPAYYIAPAAFLAVVIALVVLRKRLGRGPLTAFLFFAIVLSPALGFVSFYTMYYSFVADHYQYLGLIAIIVLGVETALWALRKLNMERMAAALFGGLGFTCAILSFSVAKLYQNPVSLFATNTQEQPNSYAWSLLAQFEESTDPEQALRDYKEALRRHEDWHAYDALGHFLLRIAPTRATQAEFDQTMAEAIASLEKLETLMPPSEKDTRHQVYAIEARRLPWQAGAHPQARGDIGINYAIAQAYFVHHDWDKAITFYKKSIDEFPRNIHAYSSVGICYIMKDDPAEAEKWLRAAISVEPRFAEAWVNLARALGMQKRDDESMQAAMRAKELDPQLEQRIQVIENPGKK